ncbi:MAG TPA: nucleoside 2-deoxyribosyltransferase [Alphaproteobacteria bacterium]|nr:nucleoside 2-deoxyribosyltransferase [Alphaproteobacteria bacterium]
MSRPIVYLSGPMTGQEYEEAESWRGAAAALLGIDGIAVSSPMRGKEALKGCGPLGGETAEIMNCGSRAITQRDRYDVRNADAMLVYFDAYTDRVSVGTMIELGWADAFSVPVVVGYNPYTPEDLMTTIRAQIEHPIVEGIAGWVVPGLGQATEVLRQLLGPMCERG